MDLSALESALAAYQSEPLRDWTPDERAAVEACVTATGNGAHAGVVPRAVFERAEAAMGHVRQFDPEIGEWYMANLRRAALRAPFSLLIKNQIVTPE